MGLDRILIYCLAFFYIVSILYALYLLYQSNKKYNAYKSYYPVKLRETNRKILQYSIDGKEWNDIMAFDDKMKWIDKDGKAYECPGFVPLKIRDDQTADEWQCCLGSLQQVHEWNQKAFSKYKEAIYKYLEENE